MTTKYKVNYGSARTAIVQTCCLKKAIILTYDGMLLWVQFQAMKAFI